MRTVSRRVLTLATAALTVAVLLLGGSSEAQTVSSPPSLKTLVAEATQLSNEVDSLGQQYDGLQIQLAQANSQVRVAKLAAARAEAAMAGSEKAVAQLAAMGYMDGGMSPTLQMITSSDPGQFLNQASTVQQVDNEAGMRVATLQREQLAARRAQAAASEEIATADQLKSEINGKVKSINSKMAILKSSAMAQAMAQYENTGTYPVSELTLPDESNAETVALRYALEKVGDWYQWGAAGPDEFDCSGLVVWAYAQEGISLPHYTGDLWNEGVHVPFDDLEPGDLVFFFADESHVGFYVGTYNGVPYFLDAPSTGQQVQIQPMEMDAYDGAVRIS